MSDYKRLIFLAGKFQAILHKWSMGAPDGLFYGHITDYVWSDLHTPSPPPDSSKPRGAVIACGIEGTDWV